MGADPPPATTRFAVVARALGAQASGSSARPAPRDGEKKGAAESDLQASPRGGLATALPAPRARPVSLTLAEAWLLCRALGAGLLVQLVRTPAYRAGGRGFNPVSPAEALSLTPPNPSRFCQKHPPKSSPISHGSRGQRRRPPLGAPERGARRPPGTSVSPARNASEPRCWKGAALWAEPQKVAS